jgi:hypothetical protein
MIIVESFLQSVSNKYGAVQDGFCGFFWIGICRPNEVPVNFLKRHYFNFVVPLFTSSVLILRSLKLISRNVST